MPTRPTGRARNNASIVDVAARVDEMSAARVARLFSVNVVRAFVCAREAVRRMSTRHGGRGADREPVVGRARLGSPGIYVDYAATKAAIDNLTLGLAREVADESIRVDGMRPGIIDTDIHATSGMLKRAPRGGRRDPAAAWARPTSGASRHVPAVGGGRLRDRRDAGRRPADADEHASRGPRLRGDRSV